MKFQEGDKIIVLATGERGEVVEWINKKMLLIEVDGIQFPVYADQINFPYYQDFSTPKPIKKTSISIVPKAEKTVKKMVERDGVWLSFFPVLDKDVFDDDIISYYKIHLLNHTDDDLSVDLSFYYGTTKQMDLRHHVRALEDMYLFDLPFENLNDQPKIEFLFSLQKTDKKRVPQYEVVFKPKPKQIFKWSEDVLINQKASFPVRLFETYPIKPIEAETTDMDKLRAAGFKIYPAEKIRRNLPAPRTLIDLHAEKLPEAEHLQDVMQIIDVQIKAFERFYEEALIHGLHSLIVIHGVGTGKLKEEIHEILRHKKEVSSFVNRLHPQFGYGATEIFIQQ
jgi:DNA-nicking Smr family endonuclease